MCVRAYTRVYRGQHTYTRKWFDLGCIGWRPQRSVIGEPTVRFFAAKGQSIYVFTMEQILVGN